MLHHVTPGYYGETGIDKRPVEGAVVVDTSGLVGDRQLSRGHGGSDKAVYAYASEDTAWWSEQLGRDLKPGVFGENLTTSGLDVTGALLGERWQIGTVELEVRMPRTPCQNLSQRVGVTGFHRDFNRSGRVGALLAVHSPGRIAAGNEVTVVSRPDHDVTIAVMAIGPTPISSSDCSTPESPWPDRYEPRHSEPYAGDDPSPDYHRDPWTPVASHSGTRGGSPAD